MKKSAQKSASDSHINTQNHKDKCQIFKLQLKEKGLDFILKRYPQFKNKFENIDDLLDLIVKSKESVIMDNKNTQNNNNIQNNDMVFNKHTLKEWIHDVHNFLRNSGAGYGMKPLNIFSLFYGLMRLEQFNMLSEFELNDPKMKFSNLLKISEKQCESKYTELIQIIRDNEFNILDTLYGTRENHPLRYTLFYEIPQHIDANVFSELIIRINNIKNIEENSNLQLSGKVYEYFIGRDESAISELGAFFTDRPIPKIIYNKFININLDINGNIPTIIDPFGGSGGLITEYISTINNKFKIDWSKNIDNINHYDMNDDVVKISGLEIMCLTRTKISPKKTSNSFKNEFDGKKFMLITSNPPFGGDTFNSDLIKPQNELLSEIKRKLKLDKNNEHLKLQKNTIENEIKYIKHNHENQKVSVNNSSERIKNYAKTHNLNGVCKEQVSMILFMDLLEKNGTACIIMKQGLFFNKSKEYTSLRKHLLENFNITNIIKIPEGSFENTNCVTSIIIFHNNGPTTSIEFSDLVVEECDKTLFETNEKGCISILENKGDIINVDYNIVKNISKEEIMSNEIYSLDICDYSNFILKENKNNAITLNSLEILDINHKHTSELLSDKYYDCKIKDLEKNKFIKYKSVVLKKDVKDSYIIKENDILISTCRPKSEKTRLVNRSDIERGLITGINKLRVKSNYINTYPSIYIYAILYQFIGEKSVKGGPRSNFERMFAKSTSYPTIKLEMLKHLDIPLHKDDNKIKEWEKKLLNVYDKDMVTFKRYSKELFNEIVLEFTMFSE